ncbi:hypothetical protein N9198_04610, partial [Akkermansiaceae bacterium]|nr:hypothetical protein [Akkermansiaceae bacterium]
MNELLRKTIMRCFLKFILPLVFMGLGISSIYAVTDPLIGYVDSVPTVAEEISSVDQNGLTIRKFR